MKHKILFVCLGNICRSPAAEGIMKRIVEKRGTQHLFHIDSAGTGNYHVGDLPDVRMREAAKRRGLTLCHRCRQVKYSDFEDFDMIIGMDASNVRNLQNMAGTISDEKKIFPIGKWLPAECGYDYVPDPYYEGREGFEITLDLLEIACENLYKDITGASFS